MGGGGGPGESGLLVRLGLTRNPGPLRTCTGGDLPKRWRGLAAPKWRPTGAARFHALCADLRAGSGAAAGRSRLRRDVGESGSRRQLDKDRVADAVDRALSCPPASVTVAVDDRDRGRSFTTREIGGPGHTQLEPWRHLGPAASGAVAECALNIPT